MTKIVLAYELLEQGITKTRIAERLQVSRRTVIRWAQAIEQHGDLGTYLEYYQQAKKGLSCGIISNPVMDTQEKGVSQLVKELNLPGQEP